MNPVMTYDEIKAQFDSEYVLLEDPVTDEQQKVLSGTLVCHSKDRDEVYRKLMELKPKHSTILYTGKIPKGTVVIL